MQHYIANRLEVICNKHEVSNTGNFSVVNIYYTYTAVLYG